MFRIKRGTKADLKLFKLLLPVMVQYKFSVINRGFYFDAMQLLTYLGKGNTLYKDEHYDRNCSKNWRIWQKHA